MSAVGSPLATTERRLAVIEKKLNRLATLMSQPPATHMTSPLLGPGLLVGWAAIARYAKKAPRTLRRYVVREGFPGLRWGRHVVSSPELINRWLLVREEERPRRRR